MSASAHSRHIGAGNTELPMTPWEDEPKFHVSHFLDLYAFSWAVFLSVSFKKLQSPGYIPRENHTL